MRLFSKCYAVPTTTATVSQYMIVNPGVYNVVLDACCDSDLYESSQETRPSYDLVKNTARNLLTMPMVNAAIAPYFGEINVTWNGDGRRVKAIFGPAPNSFAVYCEQITNGLVTYNNMNQNATSNDLRTSIDWLSTTAPTCAMQPQMA
jgi:hypothetical protein